MRDDDRLLDLARRLLDGEAIDWAKEVVAESESREDRGRIQRGFSCWFRRRAALKKTEV